MPVSHPPYLLDDPDFLAELDQFDRLPIAGAVPPQVPDAQLAPLETDSEPSPRATDRLDAFARVRQLAQLGDHLVDDNEERRPADAALGRSQSAPPRKRKQARASAAVVLVFAMGVGAGAGVAAFVFHDQVEQIVANWAR